MARFTQCCCCCDLATGAHILGIIAIIQFVAGIGFFIMAIVLTDAINNNTAVDVGLINPWFCLSLAFLIQGFMGTYGYCRMLGSNTPENRANFAKLYFYGIIIGQCSYYAFWLYYYSLISGDLPASEDSKLITQATANLIVGILLGYYFYCCLMSYAEQGEMVGELTQGMNPTSVVYGQQPGVVVMQQAPMYQQPEQVYMQPGVGGYQQPMAGVQ